MDKEKMISIVVLVLLVLGAGWYGFFGMKKGDTVKTPKAEVVATVNGVDITKTDFDSQLVSSITNLKTQGIDTEATTTQDQIKAQVLDDMINNEIVNQEIVKIGLKATDAEVNAEFQNILTQIGGQDKLNAQLASVNMTEAKLKENITKQLLVQRYLLQSIATSTLTATDKEIKLFYDETSKTQKLPPLKDVSEQIKQQIIKNKGQSLVNEFVKTLRAKATVEIKK